MCYIFHVSCRGPYPSLETQKTSQRAPLMMKVQCLDLRRKTWGPASEKQMLRWVGNCERQPHWEGYSCNSRPLNDRRLHPGVVLEHSPCELGQGKKLRNYYSLNGQKPWSEHRGKQALAEVWRRWIAPQGLQMDRTEVRGLQWFLMCSHKDVAYFPKWKKCFDSLPSWEQPGYNGTKHNKRAGTLC